MICSCLSTKFVIIVYTITYIMDEQPQPQPVISERTRRMLKELGHAKTDQNKGPGICFEKHKSNLSRMRCSFFFFVIHA